MKGRLAGSALFLAIVISTGRILGQQLDETLPGFKPNSTLEVHGIDNVNVFNGDPGVVIPSGPEYPLGPGNTWQLRAYYSAKLWHFDVSDCNTDIPPTLGVRHAYIRGYPTLGAGWTLSLGYIGPSASSDDIGDTYYFSPDGGQHKFPGGQTIDGTHLRVTAYPSTGTPSYYTVEFPDGTVQTFAHQYYSPHPVGGGPNRDFTDLTWSVLSSNVLAYGLSSVQDSFGNLLLTVDYVSNLLDNDAWKVSHINLASGGQITFSWSTHGSWDALDSISFPTANGTLMAAFTYITPNPVINRNAFDTSGATSCATGGSSSVPFLSTLALKSGSTTLASYSFSYHLTGGNLDGVLEHMTLPTGGTIDYAYSAVTSTKCFLGVNCSADPETGGPVTNWTPSAPCNFNTPARQYFQAYLDRTAAVVSRVETDPITGVSSSSTYDRNQVIPYYYNPNYTLDDCGVTRSVIVTRPSGNGSGTLATRYLFHADVIGAQGGGLELERRIYQDSNAAGTPVRTIVNCPEADGMSSRCGFRTSAGLVQDYAFLPDNGSPNPRQQSSRTWYGVNDNGGGSCAGGTTPCTASVNSDYNATAGKFATTTLTSTFSTMPGWTSRTATTNWAPCVNSTHWLLNLFSSKSVTDAGPGVPLPNSVSTTYVFNNNPSCNGFLNSYSTSDTTYGSSVTHTFTADSVWNPRTEAMTGTGQVSTTTFTNTRTFQTSLPLTDQRTGISWNSFDANRDVNTGLVTTSRLANSSLATTYAYDALGRLTTITPSGGETPTVISYDSTTQTTVRRGSGSSGTWQRYIYDGLGRLSREIGQMPSNYAFRTHTYDAAGHASFVSEWGSCTSTSGDCLTGSPGGTTSSNFDPFGRPQTITKADGTVTTISYTDGSISFSDSLQKVTVVINGANADTITRKDPLGRVIKVTEPVVGVADDTFYAYNALDKLACVKQGGTSDMTNCTSNPNGQYRAFAYYTFGFPKSETTPERGAVTYSSYDALGDVLSKTDGGTAYTSVYDAGGRLQKITSGPGAGQVYLRNCYDGTTVTCIDNMGNSSGGTYPFAKVSRRYGYNPTSTPALTVTEDFVYSSAAGRLSSQQTSLDSGSPLTSVTQNWFYNSLGLVSDHFHARPSGASFEVSTVYSYGLPVTEYVNGVPMVKSLGYQAAGGLAAYTTGIGIGQDVTTAISPDTSLIPRPRQISTTGASPNFDTGVYAYDGVGNILTMTKDTSNLDSFVYDARSRLTQANYKVSGVTTTQNFTYDRYGNMLTKAGTTFCVTTCTNNQLPSSNALYDSRGNLTQNILFGNETYSYDGLDRMITYTTSGGLTWKYFADGAAERVVRIDSTGAWSHTFRDESNRVSSEFAQSGSTSVPSRDNVFLGNLLVVSFRNAQVASSDPIWAFYSSDHLGSPRLITDISGTTQTPSPRYWPYGDIVQDPSGSTQRARFASMERDTEGSRYYDHARSHEFNLGRFLSVDKLQGRTRDPQSWNRYAYARDNPLKLVDPDGLSWLVFNQATNQLSLYSGAGNLLGVFPASRHAPWKVPLGRYPFKSADSREPHMHPGDSAAGSFGAFGIFRLKDLKDAEGKTHKNAGVHSGRVLNGGFCHATAGCFRTTELGMGQISAQAQDDPLQYLDVVSQPPKDTEKSSADDKTSEGEAGPAEYRFMELPTEIWGVPLPREKPTNCAGQGWTGIWTPCSAR